MELMLYWKIQKLIKDYMNTFKDICGKYSEDEVHGRKNL